MKATLLRTNLNQGLSTVGRVVATRGQLPVLANVLVEASKQGVVLSATNLEIGLRMQVGGKVTEEGAITIPAKNLGEFVNATDAESVELVVEGDKLKIKAGKSGAVFTGISASEFPSFAKASDGQALKIKKDVVWEIAREIAYAAAVDESRPVLTGIRFQVLGDSLIVVATDGFRLSRKVITDSKFKIAEPIILPARTIQELARVVGESNDGEVEMVTISENNQVIFVCDGVEIVSRILEGNFPDVDKIIPNQFKTEVTIDKGELERSLRQAAIFARENSNIVRFQVLGSRFIVKSQAQQLGENESEIEIEKEGEDGEIAFNYRFVLDFLASVVGERIVLKINDSLSPGVWMEEKNKNLIHLIMPVRV